MRGRNGRILRSIVILAHLVAAPALADPVCTAAVSDGFEPPCNPWLADSSWPMVHRTSYAQASSPYRGPQAAGMNLATQVALPFIPISAQFSSPYPNGRRVAWLSAVSGFEDSLLYKIDADSGRPIDFYHRTVDEQSTPRTGVAVSGVYSLVDRANRLIVGRGRAIEVFGDAEAGNPDSPIALLHRFALPPRAFCRANDVVVGLTMRFDGRLAFTTQQGMVGTLPGEPSQMSDAMLRIASVNGAACADTSIPGSQLETVSNSLAADEQGGIYPVTSRALYRFDDDGSLVESWRVAYETGSADGGGVRLDRGSGSTPTLMGTSLDDDRFVLITDGRQLMHLVLVWRDEVPADWEPIGPGKPRRIACEFPLTFGDPQATRSAAEVSPVVRGYSTFLPNNQLRNMNEIDSLGLTGTPRMAVAGFLGQDPNHAPHGFERIDWDPATRTCRTAWVNREISIPANVPALSPESGILYGIAQRSGLWGLEGLDASSGESVLWVPSGPLPTQNPFYASVAIGPQGSVWTGTFFGITIFRPASKGSLP